MVGIRHLGDAGTDFDRDRAGAQVHADQLRSRCYSDVRHREACRDRRLFDHHIRAYGERIAMLAVAAGRGAREKRVRAGCVWIGVGKCEWRAYCNSVASHLAALDNATFLIVSFFAWVFVLSEDWDCQHYENTAQDSRTYEAAIRQRRKPAPC